VVNDDLERLTSRLSQQLVKLSRPLRLHGVSGCLTADEAALESLCAQCCKVGDELLAKLQALKMTGRRTPWGSLSKAIQTAWEKRGIKVLLDRLRGFKEMLEMDIMIGLRYDLICICGVLPVHMLTRVHQGKHRSY